MAPFSSSYSTCYWYSKAMRKKEWSSFELSHQPWHNCLTLCRSSDVRPSIACRLSTESSEILKLRLYLLGLTSRRSLIYFMISICSCIAPKLTLMQIESRMGGRRCPTSPMC